MRLVIDPVNYLRPEVVPDPVLKLRVEAGSAGHDAWGFRNAGVPDRVDLVAAGDSQTYGNNAPATEAWPHWFGRASGSSVYNLSSTTAIPAAGSCGRRRGGSGGGSGGRDRARPPVPGLAGGPGAALVARTLGALPSAHRFLR